MAVRREVVLAILPKISSVMSMFGSSWIMLEVLFDEDIKQGARIRKRELVYHRLLFVMSVYDMLEVVWEFQSTWPVPRGTPHVFQAFGNQATCDAQGFFLQLGLGIPLYNAFLALYYLLVIKYNVSEKRLRERIEPCMHLFAFVVSVGTSLVALFMRMYNFATLWCWIAPYPSGCSGSSCIRGQNAWQLRYAFYFGPLWTAIAFACFFMISVYLDVRAKDAKSRLYRHPELKFGQPPTEQQQQQPDAQTQPQSQPPPEELPHTPRSSVLEQPKLMKMDSFRHPPTSSAASMASTLAPPKIGKALKEWRKARKKEREELKNTHDVFDQALWYLGTFVFTHFFSTLTRTVQAITGKNYFVLIAMQAFVNPWQGTCALDMIGLNLLGEGVHLI